jgi:CcmD family protein
VTYLFAAYSAIWILLFAYVFSIARRQQKIQDEVNRVQRLLDSRKKPSS